jgi:hypothetical protein
VMPNALKVIIEKRCCKIQNETDERLMLCANIYTKIFPSYIKQGLSNGETENLYKYFTHDGASIQSRTKIRSLHISSQKVNLKVKLKNVRPRQRRKS